MSIAVNTLVFLITIICVIYLALKFKYFKENKHIVIRRRFKNVVDISLVVSILLFCIMHVNSFINSLQNGVDAESYIKYIAACLSAYFIWIFVNVKLYRQELQKAVDSRGEKKK